MGRLYNALTAIFMLLAFIGAVLDILEKRKRWRGGNGGGFPTPAKIKRRIMMTAAALVAGGIAIGATIAAIVIYVL